MAISLYIFEGVIANHTRTTTAATIALTKNAKNSINKTKNTNQTTKTRAAKQEHPNPDNVMATKRNGKREKQSNEAKLWQENKWPMLPAVLRATKSRKRHR